MKKFIVSYCMLHEEEIHISKAKAETWKEALETALPGTTTHLDDDISTAKKEALENGWIFNVKELKSKKKEKPKKEEKIEPENDEIINTIVVWDSKGEPLRFFVMEGDRAYLNDVYINGSNTEDEIDLLKSEIYGEDFKFKFKLLKKFPHKVYVKGQTRVIVAGYDL